MKSNCNRAAWDAYKQDPKHLRMCFHATAFSKWVGKVPGPIRWIALQLCAGWFYVFTVLHLFAFERWPHWYWCKHTDCNASEFVPLEVKSRRWIPPFEFDGKVRSGDQK